MFSILTPQIFYHFFYHLVLIYLAVTFSRQFILIRFSVLYYLIFIALILFMLIIILLLIIIIPPHSFFYHHDALPPHLALLGLIIIHQVGYALKTIALLRLLLFIPVFSSDSQCISIQNLISSSRVLHKILLNFDLEAESSLYDEDIISSLIIQWVETWKV